MKAGCCSTVPWYCASTHRGRGTWGSVVLPRLCSSTVQFYPDFCSRFVENRPLLDGFSPWRHFSTFFQGTADPSGSQHVKGQIQDCCYNLFRLTFLHRLDRDRTKVMDNAMIDEQRQCVALNNQGAAMIKVGAYDQAIRTLCEAMASMKKVLRRQQQRRSAKSVCAVKHSIAFWP